jgi:hypothetical protein
MGGKGRYTPDQQRNFNKAVESKRRELEASMTPGHKDQVDRVGYERAAERLGLNVRAAPERMDWSEAVDDLFEGPDAVGTTANSAEVAVATSTPASSADVAVAASTPASRAEASAPNKPVAGPPPVIDIELDPEYAGILAEINSYQLVPLVKPLPPSPQKVAPPQASGSENIRPSYSAKVSTPRASSAKKAPKAPKQTPLSRKDPRRPEEKVKP